MRVVYILALVYILLILPQFFSLYAIYDSEVKKAYFSFYFFQLNIFGGYITFNQNKLYVHLRNKVKILNLNDYFCGKKRLVNIRFEFYKIRSVCVLGVNNYINLYFGGALFFLNNQICPIAKAKKSFLKIKNDLAFTNDENIKIAIQIKFFTNLLDVILLAFKNIIKELIKCKNKKKIK